ncbi:hypothetical protein BJV77DRAFT_1037867, partial [Russula vinacea]
RFRAHSAAVLCAHDHDHGHARPRNAARFAVVTITATSRSAHVRAKAQEALGGTGYSALVRAGWEVERWAQLLVRVRVKKWVRRSVSGVVGVGRIGVRR